MLGKFKREITVFLAFAVCFIGSGAHAGPFFSVDIASDELVRIESTTGAVSVVGALGTDAIDIDLTRTADGRLWGLNSNFGSRVDLLEISTSTGAVLSTTQVNLSGIQNAEGLGHSGNQLTIGHSVNSSASNFFSELATDGTISNSIQTSVDIDGMSAGSGTTPYYLLDAALIGAWRTLIHTFDPSIPSSSQIANILTGSEPIGNDRVIDGTDIFYIDGGITPELFNSSLASPGTAGSIDLDRAGSYRGLAIGTSVAVAEPGMLLGFASGLAIFGVIRRRRRR